MKAEQLAQLMQRCPKDAEVRIYIGDDFCRTLHDRELEEADLEFSEGAVQIIINEHGTECSHRNTRAEAAEDSNPSAEQPETGAQTPQAEDITAVILCPNCGAALGQNSQEKDWRAGYAAGVQAGLIEGLHNSMDNAELVIAQAIADWRQRMEERGNAAGG